MILDILFTAFWVFLLFRALQCYRAKGAYACRSFRFFGFAQKPKFYRTVDFRRPLNKNE